MIRQTLSILFLFSILGCDMKVPAQGTDPIEILKQKEKESGEKSNDHLGKFVGNILFEVITTDTANFKDGIIPWASIAEPDRDIPDLKDGKEIIINNKIVTLVIDYPVKTEYKVNLKSETGFSRALLLKEISKAYYRMYEEEENTAKTKTIPVEERTTLANRNETDGKYGIWGHDISDLDLSEIRVYKTSDGSIVISLNIES